MTRKAIAIAVILGLLLGFRVSTGQRIAYADPMEAQDRERGHGVADVDRPMERQVEVGRSEVGTVGPDQPSVSPVRPIVASNQPPTRPIKEVAPKPAPIPIPAPDPVMAPPPPAPAPAPDFGGGESVTIVVGGGMSEWGESFQIQSAPSPVGVSPIGSSGFRAAAWGALALFTGAAIKAWQAMGGAVAPSQMPPPGPAPAGAPPGFEWGMRVYSTQAAEFWAKKDGVAKPTMGGWMHPDGRVTPYGPGGMSSPPSMSGGPGSVKK